MKKILFLINTLSYGGAEKVLVNLVNNMDRDRFDITVQTLFDVGVNKESLSKNVKYVGGLKKAIPGNSHIMKLFSPKALFKFFIKDHYDIIVSYLEGPVARIVSGCTDENTKLVSWIHIEQRTAKEASLSFRNEEEALECYNKFNKIICVSETVKKDFKLCFDVSVPVEVLYNTNESDIIRKKSKEELDDVVFEKDAINIISVAKIVPSKGYNRLAKIHKRLLDEGIKNHVYILGVGEQKEEILKYLKENNLSSSFTFLGFNKNPYKYVSKADLYVCSSLREGFSTAVTEALIVGTPVVSTNCSGAYELLGYNNEYGIVTDNNEESLFCGIKRMLTEKNLLDFYREKAEFRGNSFSTEITVNAVMDMLDNL